MDRSRIKDLRQGVVIVAGVVLVLKALSLLVGAPFDLFAYTMDVMVHGGPEPFWAGEIMLGVLLVLGLPAFRFTQWPFCLPLLIASLALTCQIHGVDFLWDPKLVPAFDFGFSARYSAGLDSYVFRLMPLPMSSVIILLVVMIRSVKDQGRVQGS